MESCDVDWIIVTFLGMSETDASLSEIGRSLERFLKKGAVSRVYFAGGGLGNGAQRVAPPAPAYLVNFPRLSVVLQGRDDMQIEVGGSIETVRLGRGDAVFVPANCWNLPAWRFGV